MVYFNYINSTLRAYLRWVKIKEKGKLNQLKVDYILSSLDTKKKVEVSPPRWELGPKEIKSAQKETLAKKSLVLLRTRMCEVHYSTFYYVELQCSVRFNYKTCG